MRFSLLAFGVAREIVGNEITVDNSDIRDVQSLRIWLSTTYPLLSGLNKWAIAVNEKYATDSTLIAPGDVVAIIPPVSGG